MRCLPRPRPFMSTKKRNILVYYIYVICGLFFSAFVYICAKRFVNAFVGKFLFIIYWISRQRIGAPNEQSKSPYLLEVVYLLLLCDCIYEKQSDATIEHMSEIETLALDLADAVPILSIHGLQ